MTNLIRLRARIKALILRATTSHLVGYPLPFLPMAPGYNQYCLPRPEPGRPGATPESLPIPPVALRPAYPIPPQAYLDSGRTDVQNMLDTLAQHGGPLPQAPRILELGCATGRMLRWHLEAARRGEVWGCDIHAPSIAWSQRYLSAPFRFFTATTVPHIPFPDGSFDLIYAGSVFTHIDDLADMWLLELRRLLAPGGRLYITLHDRRTIDILLDRPELPLARYVRAFPEFDRFRSGEFAKFTFGRCMDSQVFYDIDHFCQMVEPFLRTLAVRPEAYSIYQTAVLLQRR